MLKPDSPILLDCFEYKQDEMTGPPFAVLKDELRHLFGDDYTFTLLHEQDLFNELTKFQRRGLQSYLHEMTYHLEPK